MAASDTKLAGKVALITGGGGGMGLMMAQGFAKAGAKVYITGRRVKLLEDAAASIKDVPGSVIAEQLDVTEEASIQALVKKIEEVDGKLNILVNNAGQSYSVTDPDFFNKKMTAFFNKTDPFEVETMDNWVDVFKVNAIAPFFVIKAFLGLLTKGGQEFTSSVINISSCVAVMSSPFAPATIGYSPAKAAVNQLTKLLATEFATREIPIRVNAIQPGLFPSELVTDDLIDTTKTTPLPGHTNLIPVKRAGRPEEIANAAIYLTLSEYTNGAILRLDGGVTLVNA